MGQDASPLRPLGGQAPPASFQSICHHSVDNLIGLREWRERHFINAVTGETQWFCTVVMLSLN